jgi:hypothetical protein
MAVTSKTKKDRHKRLLAAGFFPEELPPPFTTVDLSKHRDALLSKFNSIPQLKNGDPWFYVYRSTASPIYFPRFGKQDRKHFILNPVGFFFLSKEVADHWVEIRKLLKKSRISASLPIFDWTEGRSLLPNNFGERDKRTATLSVRNNFLLKSDLSRFYHSIYTHALAWAVHGKSVAKKNKSYSLLGNRLDLLSRNGQDGQTIGVPVGPETSRILAELVGTAIDQDLLRESKVGMHDCMRFVDDFALGVSLREDAERVLSLLRRIAHSYELEINEEKTSIESVYNLEYASWRHEIKLSRPNFGSGQSAFERYFDRLHTLSTQRPHDNVIRYAIKVSRALFVSASPWPSIEDFILLAYRKNASVLPSLVEILVSRHTKKKDVDLTKVSNFIGSNVRRLSETEKHGELAWLLFLAAELSLEVKVSQVENIFGLNCPASALHVCHLHSLGLIKKSIDRKNWNTSLDGSGLTSEMWLYAYEASLKGWTGVATKKFISADKAFAPLWEKKVSFFDINAHVLDVSASSKKDMVLSLKVKSAAANELFKFDFEDTSNENDEWLAVDDYEDDWSDY